MVHYSKSRIDQTFAALSDFTRRGILMHLARKDTSITKLAEHFHMSLTGMKKHIGILEKVGLVKTEKVGRVRTCKLGPHQFEPELAWIERYKDLWDKKMENK